MGLCSPTLPQLLKNYLPLPFTTLWETFHILCLRFGLMVNHSSRLYHKTMYEYHSEGIAITSVWIITYHHHQVKCAEEIHTKKILTFIYWKYSCKLKLVHSYHKAVYILQLIKSATEPLLGIVNQWYLFENTEVYEIITGWENSGGRV